MLKKSKILERAIMAKPWIEEVEEEYDKEKSHYGDGNRTQSILINKE